MLSLFIDDTKLISDSLNLTKEANIKQRDNDRIQRLKFENFKTD
jgi:hypothetical protein